VAVVPDDNEKISENLIRTWTHAEVRALRRVATRQRAPAQGTTRKSGGNARAVCLGRGAIIICRRSRDAVVINEEPDEP
jgi:hypothetical protein